MKAVIRLKQYTSAIIAFNLEGEKWLEDLAQPFGKDAISDFHVTLVWLGNASKLDKESVQAKIAGLAETYAPISGVFNGVAKFTDSGDGVPVVLTFDSPALPGFRQALREAFPDVEQNHGFTAHTTLAYTNADINLVKLEKPIEYTFNSIWLFWAGERYEYPLVGDIVTKQLPIDDASKNNLIEVRVNIFNDDVTALAERLYTGDISLNAWEEAMRKYIRELHTSIAAIGKGGWDNMTWEDWGRLGPILKNQYQYLHAFAEYIAANRETITLAQLQARAKYYGENAKQTAGFIITPIAIEKQLPWMPRMGNGNIGMENGDGTDCRMRCCCGWELKIVSKEGDFNIVDATWTLSPAEHCDTCIERDGYTVTIRVYKDIPVPESIGFYCD